MFEGGQKSDEMCEERVRILSFPGRRSKVDVQPWVAVQGEGLQSRAPKRQNTKLWPKKLNIRTN